MFEAGGNPESLLVAGVMQRMFLDFAALHRGYAYRQYAAVFMSLCLEANNADPCYSPLSKSRALLDVI